MALAEINFDGIVGPSHNYAGLSLGNLASTAQRRRRCREPRAAALQGVDKMRANLALGLAQGIFLPHPRPNRAWLAELGTDIERRRPGARRQRHVGLGDVGGQCGDRLARRPTPPTARCHLTVANLRTMPHRSHEWPATLAQLRLAFADATPSRSTRRSRRRSATRARPTTCGWRRRTASRASRCSSTASRGGAFPARQHLEASKAIARLHRLDPERDAVRRAIGSRRSPPARSTTTSSRSPTSACCSRTSRRSPTRRPLIADVRAAACPGSNMSRCRRRRRAAGRRDPILSVQRPAGHACPTASMTLIVPDRGARDAVGVALDRAACRRQRPDPPGRGGRRPPVDGQWRRPGLPAAARRRRSGDGRSALPGRRGQARPDRRRDRARTGPSRSTTTNCSSRR